MKGMNIVRAEVMGLVAAAAFAALAQGQGRDDFLRQQAVAEMQRVSGQVDVLQNNLEEISRRVSRLEAGGGETRHLQQQIDSLRATVADLRRQLESQRGEIVRDISGRIARLQTPPPPPEKKTVRRTVVTAPHFEYTVKSGDSLSLIAKAFNTSVQAIRDFNGMKKDAGLRVGQKIKVPKN